MKKTFTFLMILLSQFSFSQNLVPNPSFEQYDTCPNLYGQINRSLYWQNFGNTPDYYNACGGNGGLGVPNTAAGYQYPHTGNAMSGAICFDGTDVGANYREFIGVELTHPLQTGIKYYLSFYINKAEGQGFTLGANKIGAKFSNIVYSENISPPLTNSAQIYIDSIVKDTVGWFQVKGSFVTDSNYQYLIIGNFFDDRHTDTSGFGAFPLVAYYFIDDVCLETDSSCFEPSGVATIEKSDINIYPNPVNDILIIKNSNQRNEIIIYNELGACVYANKFSQYETEISVKGFSEGIYFIQILNNENEKITNKFVVQHSF